MSQRKIQELAKSKARNRMTNGHVLPRSVDQRTRWARRLKDLLALHIGDLGGEDAASASERAIARRACVLICELERVEETWALRGQSEPREVELYQRCSNTMRRLLESIGLQRRAKPVPSLAQYLEAKANKVDDDAEADE